MSQTICRILYFPCFTLYYIAVREVTVPTTFVLNTTDHLRHLRPRPGITGAGLLSLSRPRATTALPVLSLLLWAPPSAPNVQPALTQQRPHPPAPYVQPALTQQRPLRQSAPSARLAPTRRLVRRHAPDAPAICIQKKAASRAHATPGTL